MNAVVAELVENAEPANAWPDPDPIIDPIHSKPYPVDALPDVMRDAVAEVRDYMQAPEAMIAMCALSVLSVATQGLYDVARDTSLVGPCSLFSLCIASSGERKTSVDKYFTQPVRDYESTQRFDSMFETQQFDASTAAWEAKKAGIKAAIQNKAKNNKPCEDLEEQLIGLEESKPIKPKVPHLLYQDATPEALVNSLADDWPSAGIFSDEGGAVTGAHGMSKDSLTRNLATLNQLWGGQTVSHTRMTRQSVTVENARLTVALQIQEPALRDFLDSSRGMPRGTGFFARFLIAWPESTQGTRMYKEPPKENTKLDAYNASIRRLLETSPDMDEHGRLNPTTLPLSDAAKQIWVAFHNYVEGELSEGRELGEISDTASKVAENAARLAGLFETLQSTKPKQINATAMQSGIQIAAWHLHESMRFFRELATPVGIKAASVLDEWILQQCREQNTECVTRRDMQRVGPHSVRKPNVLTPALITLEELGRIRRRGGKNSHFDVNPVLLEEGRK